MPDLNADALDQGSASSQVAAEPPAQPQLQAPAQTQAIARKPRTSIWDAGIFTNRHDGTLVRNATHVRRMMPYIMPTRAESFVFHKQVFDLTKTLPWIENWNTEHPETPLKLFDLITMAVMRAGTMRPGMMRFVAGGRLYDRKHPTMSLAVKRERSDYAPIRMVKFEARGNEEFSETVTRFRSKIDEERNTKKATHTERELAWFEILPGWMTSWIAGPLVRSLDWWGFYPESMTKGDPLFSAMCISNVGSLGVSRVKHHLYEYGNIGLFCVVNEVKEKVVPRKLAPGEAKPSHKERGTEIIDAITLDWTFDERTNDAHYCAESLKLAQGWVENPETLAAPLDQEHLQERLERDRRAAQGAMDVEAADQ